MIKDPVKPEDQDDLPEERTDGGGAGTFWAVFLIMFFLAGAAVFAKMFGKQCREKVNEMRGVDVTVPDLYSAEQQPIMD